MSRKHEKEPDVLPQPPDAHLLAEAISRYARAVGGARDDLDPDLEAAGIEHWLNTLEDSDEVDQG